MAILKGLTTNLSGSAGAWTFYDRLGTTVAKEKMDSRGRKKLSDAQLDHIARWGSLVSFWSHTGGCLRHGFRHKQRGQSDFNLFTSANFKDNRVFLTREMMRQGACVAAPYQLTDGTLPTIHFSESDDGRVRTDIQLGDDFVIAPDTPIRDIGLAIVDNNSDFRHGDKLFCIVMEQQAADQQNVPHVKVRTNTLPIDLAQHLPFSTLVEQWGMFANVEGHLGASHPLTGGIAWIHTRPRPNALTVSTQWMFVSGAPNAPYSTPAAHAAAQESYRQ